MFNIQRAAVREMHPEWTKRTGTHHFPQLLNGHGSHLPLPFYHLSPNCSPPLPPLRGMPPRSGPPRLGTANSRGGSSASTFSFPSVAFSGLAMAALSERLIRWASGSTSSTLHSTSSPSFTTFSTL